MSLSGIDCPEVASHHAFVDPADLGRRIKRAREARGWGQQELADALTRQRRGRRVGVRSVGRWERGETTPRNATGALEAVLGISLNGTAPAPESYNDDPLYEAIWAETSLPPGVRREIIQQIRQARSGPAARTERPPALGQ